MRVDKYLKVSRLIKRRTVAKEACDLGRIQVNGRVVKAGYELKIGDRLQIELGTRRVQVEIVDIQEHVLRQEARDLYKVLEDVGESAEIEL
jgi:ribosomal 50S subunit-recycling heat shock protein